jgi:uncharacterized cupin superfamily protein
MSIVLPGEGRSVQIGTSHCTFKVTGHDTHGHFGIFEYVLEPESGGSSYHIHKEMVEIFYVVDGEVELTLDQETITAQPGTFMTVPEHTPHAFANPGTKRSTLLIMFCPDRSRENYFEGLADLMKEGRNPSQDELRAWARQFDQYPAESSTL